MPAVTPTQRAALNDVLLTSFQVCEQTAQGTVLSRLLLNGHSIDEDIRGKVAAAIGPDGEGLIEQFVKARAALSSKLAERFSATRSELTSHLHTWLSRHAVYRDGDKYTFNDIEGGTATAVRVLHLDSAQRTKTGGLWGFLRVSVHPNCSETWEFSLENGKFSVRSKQGVF